MVALGITLSTQVEVIAPGPQKAVAIKVPLDPPDRLLQHLAHLAGLEMSKAKAEELLDSNSMDGLVVEIGSGAVLLRAVRSPLEARETPALLEAALSLSAAVVDDERSSSGARHS